MVSVVFIVLASFCNSIMDVISHHWSTSIFTKIKDNFFYNWFREDSWKLKYIGGNPDLGRIKWEIFGIKFNKPVQITDAWHFFKMLMIVFICFGIVFYKSFFFYFHNIIIDKLFEILILGTIWNLIFSLFYNYLLTLKFWKFIFKE